MQVTNITLNQYLSLDADSLFEYNWVIEYSNEFNTPENHFNIDIYKCSFGFVKDLQYYLEHGLTWQQFIESVQEELKQNILENDLLSICQFRKFLINKIEEIVRIESESLDTGISAQDERAGIERLAPFGVYAQLRQYAQAFNQTIDWARKQKYEEAFTELAYQAALSNYQEKLFKIRQSST